MLSLRFPRACFQPSSFHLHQIDPTINNIAISNATTKSYTPLRHRFGPLAKTPNHPIHPPSLLGILFSNPIHVSDTIRCPRAQDDPRDTEDPPHARTCVDFSAADKNLDRWNLRRWINGGGWVHDGARVDSSVIVEPNSVIHSGASVGPRSRVGSGSVVGSDVTVGTETVLGYNVKLQNCTIGDRCVLYNGVAVGQDGFGFFVDEKGNMVKKPQNLRVQIGNDVEIGANTCIDRGSWRDTKIGDQCKIDNLVQVGHNVVMGRCCIICGQVGIGGSSTLGDYVVLAGQVGVADHVTITSKVRVAAKSGVTSNITLPGDYAGFPTMPAKEWRKMVIIQRKSVKRSSSSQAEDSDLFEH